MISKLILESSGRFEYYDEDRGCKCSAGFPLFLIHAAWNKGCSFEAEADGFGPGFGTHGDWSAIRDSSEPATARMLEKAINFLDLK